METTGVTGTAQSIGSTVVGAGESACSNMPVFVAGDDVKISSVPIGARQVVEPAAARAAAVARELNAARDRSERGGHGEPPVHRPRIVNRTVAVVRAPGS
jgi:hypothetical protein